MAGAITGAVYHVAIPGAEAGGSGNANDDVLTLTTLQDQDGKRLRIFRDSERLCQETPLNDLPAPGGWIASYRLNQITDHVGGSAVSHSMAWVHQWKLQASDCSAIEPMEWNKTLDLMLCVDQLVAADLCSAEMIYRNFQRLEDRLKGKMRASLDAAAGSFWFCFASTASGCAGLVIDPRLLKFFGEQAAQQLLTAMEPRKARREMAPRRAKKKTRDKECPTQ